MIRGSILQRLIEPHLTNPVDIPEKMKKNIKKHREEKDERDRSRHVQRKGGQSR